MGKNNSSFTVSFFSSNSPKRPCDCGFELACTMHPEKLSLNLFSTVMLSFDVKMSSHIKSYCIYSTVYGISLILFLEFL